MIMKRYGITAVAFIILIAAVLFLPKETYSKKIKIGVGDDSSGKVVEYIADNKSTLKFDINKEYETFQIKDC